MFDCLFVAWCLGGDWCMFDCVIVFRVNSVVRVILTCLRLVGFL